MTPPRFKRQFERLSLPQRTAGDTSSLFTLLEMVGSDLGITFVPAMAVSSVMLRQTGMKNPAAGPEGTGSV